MKAVKVLKMLTLDISCFINEDDTASGAGGAFAATAAAATRHGDVRRDVAQRELVTNLNAMFSKVGFVYITGAGALLPPSLIADAQAISRAFFSLPADEKRQSAYRAPVPRGYSGVNKENFGCLNGKVTPNDLVEKFRCGPFERPAGDPYYHTKDAEMMFFGNQFPATPAAMETTLRQFYAAMHRVAAVLLRVFERALRLRGGHLGDHVTRAKHTSILSMNYYPAPASLPANMLLPAPRARIAKHTDVDLFTLLIQDEGAGGLQVCSPVANNNDDDDDDDDVVDDAATDSGDATDAASNGDGNDGDDGDDSGDVWRDVPFRPNTLVCNLGDCLQYWTDGRWRSTAHRVVLPSSSASSSSSSSSLSSSSSSLSSSSSSSSSSLSSSPPSEERHALAYFVGAHYDAFVRPLRATDFVDVDGDGDGGSEDVGVGSDGDVDVDGGSDGGSGGVDGDGDVSGDGIGSDGGGDADVDVVVSGGARDNEGDGDGGVDDDYYPRAGCTYMRWRQLRIKEAMTKLKIDRQAGHRKAAASMSSLKAKKIGRAK
jgi:isopenicillin N synthase-like dioxygenase